MNGNNYGSYSSVGEDEFAVDLVGLGDFGVKGKHCWSHWVIGHGSRLAPG